MASYVAYRAACVPLSEVEIFHNRIVNERLLMHFYYSTSECKIQILLKQSGYLLFRSAGGNPVKLDHNGYCGCGT